MTATPSRTTTFAIGDLSTPMTLDGRYRCLMALEHSSAELRDLIAFTGLDDALPRTPVDPPAR